MVELGVLCVWWALCFAMGYGLGRADAYISNVGRRTPGSFVDARFLGADFEGRP